MNDIPVLFWVAVSVIGLIVIRGLYRTFWKSKKNEGVQIENIRAKLILLSTDPKEIEDFLMLKEPYITQELIDLLIARVAELKNNKVDLTAEEPVNFGKVMIEREMNRR